MWLNSIKKIYLSISYSFLLNSLLITSQLIFNCSLMKSRYVFENIISYFTLILYIDTKASASTLRPHVLSQTCTHMLGRRSTSPHGRNSVTCCWSESRVCQWALPMITFIPLISRSSLPGHTGFLLLPVWGSFQLRAHGTSLAHFEKEKVLLAV